MNEQTELKVTLTDNEGNEITEESTPPVKQPVPYEDMIGQPAAKRALTHMLNNYLKSRYFPTTLFVAGKGQGKTTMATETARHLCTFNEIGAPEINAATGFHRIKPLVKINCAGITSVKSFINSYVIPHINDKDVTVLFDEASEIPKKVSMAMLDIFNTDLMRTNYRTQYRLDEYVCDFDFRRQTYLFCTSEPNKVFHALKDRFEEINLGSYTNDELGKIFLKHLPGVELEDGVINEIASVVRGNARNAWKLAMHARGYLQDSKVFMMDDWNELKNIYNILPLGLNPIEVEILRYLNGQASGTSLTRLSAKSGMSRDALQKECELYLQKHDLMAIETKGRHITNKGQDYLKSLDGHVMMPSPATGS